MSEQSTEQTQEQLSEQFSNTLNQFIANSYQLFARLEEVEKAVAYLLSKDKDWMAAFNASMAQQEPKAQENGQQQEIIMPVSD
jgi:hypothetical protein